MIHYPERRVSKAAEWARRLASFSAVLFLTAAIGHRLAFLETPGFIVVLGLVATLAIASLLLAAQGFAGLWNYGDIGGRNIGVAAVIASLVLAPFAVALYRGVMLPMLSDISTDLEDPPALAVAASTRTSEMNPLVAPTLEKKRLQLEEYPLVTGRRYDMTFERVLETVLRMVEDRGWRVVSPPAPPGRTVEVTVEAVARSLILSFPVDIAIRLTDEGPSTFVDMRSASRYGRHDLGDNATRIAEFLGELDGHISALAGVVPAEPEPEDTPLFEPVPQF